MLPEAWKGYGYMGDIFSYEHRAAEKITQDRTVLLLLVHLLSVQDLDAFLAARADSGRNHIWVEFSLLFIRTAFMEQISSPTDFPKSIDLMARLTEGRLSKRRVPE
jgi:hypothetical protein